MRERWIQAQRRLKVALYQWTERTPNPRDFETSATGDLTPYYAAYDRHAAILTGINNALERCIQRRLAGA